MFARVVVIGTPEQQARLSVELLQRGRERTFAVAAEEMGGVMITLFGRLLHLRAVVRHETLQQIARRAPSAPGKLVGLAAAAGGE
jgi:hypothetical protein